MTFYERSVKQYAEDLKRLLNISTSEAYQIAREHIVPIPSPPNEVPPEQEEEEGDREQTEDFTEGEEQPRGTPRDRDTEAPSLSRPPKDEEAVIDDPDFDGNRQLGDRPEEEEEEEEEEDDDDEDDDDDDDDEDSDNPPTVPTPPIVVVPIPFIPPNEDDEEEEVTDDPSIDDPSMIGIPAPPVTDLPNRTNKILRHTIFQQMKPPPLTELWIYMEDNGDFDTPATGFSYGSDGVGSYLRGDVNGGSDNFVTYQGAELPDMTGNFEIYFGAQGSGSPVATDKTVRIQFLSSGVVQFQALYEEGNSNNGTMYLYNGSMTLVKNRSVTYVAGANHCQIRFGASALMGVLSKSIEEEYDVDTESWSQSSFTDTVSGSEIDEIRIYRDVGGASSGVWSQLYYLFIRVI